MAAPQVMVSGRSTHERISGKALLIAQSGGPQGWALLGWAGAAFFAIGVLDLILAWVPAAFGSPAWEFATVTASLNGLPLPAMGLVLLIASAIVRDAKTLIRGTAAMLVLLSVCILLAGLLFATVAPVAFADVDGALLRTGLTKAVVKTGTLILLFPILFLTAAIKGWRHARALP